MREIAVIGLQDPKLYHTTNSILAEGCPCGPDVHLMIIKAMEEASDCSVRTPVSGRCRGNDGYALSQIKPDDKASLLAMSRFLQRGLTDSTYYVLSAIGSVRPRDPEVLAELEKGIEVLKSWSGDWLFGQPNYKRLSIDWLDDKN